MMHFPSSHFVIAIAVSAFSLFGCGDNSTTNKGHSSSGGVGGSSGSTGGASSNAGGSAAKGGNSGTGGAANGGTSAKAGGTASGGSANGGATIATDGSAGGTTNSGGSQSGGITTNGGATINGGATGKGGATGGSGITGEVERWGLYEVILTGPSSGNPYVDVQWSATFTQGDKTIKMPGFWDGDSTYKVRFSPPTTGEWTYQTTSTVAELNGKTGSVKVGDATGINHGPIEVFETYYFRYADGTRYHHYGTTSYQWTSMPEDLQQTTLKTLSTAPFTKYRYCVFPKWYAHNQVEPDLAAFQKGANGKYDFSKPDPAYWKRFEQRLIDLQKMGIEADIILWHPYDHWGFKSMGAEADDRYLRYSIARLSAYRNVWWALANEWDFTGKPESDFNRFGEILLKEDPYQRLRSIHNGSKRFDQTKPWITHVSYQGYNTDNGIALRETFKKPYVFDEMGYEGNIPEGYGRNPPTLTTQRFYWGTFSGVYCGHSECYQDPNEILWWGKGGVLKGESPARIKYLKEEIMDKAPPFPELKPMGNLLLAKEGEYYAIYCKGAGSKTVQLSGTRSYKVEMIDTWGMTVTPVGTAPPGAYTFSAPKGDVVYRFVPVP